MSNEADREKRLVALSSIAAAVFLTTIKFIAGLLTGSLGILSEAAHSLLDLVAAVITFFAVRVSSRPADREHQFGHAKFENLSALFETVLLLVTCVWIIYEAVERLFFVEAEIKPSAWAFVVMGLSIIIDLSRSRALYRVARKYDSQALEADALHFSTDVWSSSVVILGLICVTLAPKLNIPWLVNADAIAALIVAGIVIYVSLQLGGRTVSALTDSAPPEWTETITAAVQAVPGVQKVERVRARRAGHQIFADVSISIGESSLVEQANDISSSARQAICEIFPTADVVVQVNAAETDRSKLLSTVRVLAARRNLGAHAIRLCREANSDVLELHLEVDETLSLEQAHEQVSGFEHALKETLPQIDKIVSHIEPSGEETAKLHSMTLSERSISDALHQLKQELGIDLRPHSVRHYAVRNEISVSFHCYLDGRTNVAAAHDWTIKAEQALRAKLPDLGRVVIHVEPPDADQ